MTTITTLKPCPFCNGEPSFGRGEDYVFIHCPDCLASHVMAADMQKWDEDMAAEAWNERQN